MEREPIDIRDPGRWTWAAALEPRTASDTTDDVKRILEKLEATGQDQLVLRLVANSPNSFRPFVLMANSLVNEARLPADVREAVVLHLAVALGDDYEWHSHIHEAHAAGLSPTQIQSIIDGAERGSALSDGQQLGIRLVDRLRLGERWSDDDWDAAIELWGREGAMDLAMSAGWWAGLVPAVIRAMRLAPRA